MKQRYKLVLAEFAWLFIAAIITVVFCWALFYWNLKSATFDFHFHDTFFVLDTWQVLIPIFLFVVFFLFFIKEAFKYFSQTIPNVVILITGLLLIGVLILLNREFLKVGVSIGWTSYPPLSALPEPKPTINFDPVTIVIANVITALQIIVTASLLVVTFRWGRGK
jgi:hypothetical protein